MRKVRTNKDDGRVKILFLVILSILATNLLRDKLSVSSGVDRETDSYLLTENDSLVISGKRPARKLTLTNEAFYPILFQKIPVNQASPRLLQTVPTVGEKLSEAIVFHRTHFGPFANYQQLIKVNGIGKKRAEYLNQYFSFE